MGREAGIRPSRPILRFRVSISFCSKAESNPFPTRKERHPLPQDATPRWTGEEKRSTSNTSGALDDPDKPDTFGEAIHTDTPTHGETPFVVHPPASACVGELAMKGRNFLAPSQQAHAHTHAHNSDGPELTPFHPDTDLAHRCTLGPHTRPAMEERE